MKKKRKNARVTNRPVFLFSVLKEHHCSLSTIFVISNINMPYTQGACAPCRQAHQKCDSGRPCANCVANKRECFEQERAKSCSMCRQLKQRCDRERPCSRCIRNNQAGSCSSMQVQREYGPSGTHQMRLLTPCLHHQKPSWHSASLGPLF